MKKGVVATLLAVSLGCTMLSGCGSLTTGGSSEDISSTEDVKEESNTETSTVDSGSGNTTTAATSADSVTEGIVLDVESFNPWMMAQDARQQVYYNKIFEPLANLTMDGERQLVLAKSVEADGSGCYDIELWDDIYDSAGNQITADDVIFSFDQCNEVGQLAWATRYLDHFEKTGDYTLKMYTKDESSVGLDMLLKTVFIVSQKSYEASSDQFATTPVGTGPYTLEKYVPGSSIALTARDDYWQTDDSARSQASTVGNIKTINYKIITDASQLALALEMGEVDVVAGQGISNSDYSNFMDDSRKALAGYTVEPYLNALIAHLEFNCGEGSALQDENLRQAVTYAIDKQAIVTNIFGSDANVCNTNSSPYYSDYDSSLDETAPYPYDPDKAKEKLADAGYGEGEITLKLITQNIDYFTKTATLIQAYLEAVGIHCDVSVCEDALFQTNRADTTGTAWDICLNTVMGLNSTGRLGVVDLNSYETGKNGLYIDDEVLQEKYETANLASTYSKETVTDLLKYIDEKCYICPLYYQMGYVISKDYITDIVLDRNAAMIPGASTINAK